MSEDEKKLAKSTLIILGIISAIIFIVGSILILLGYNEGFYIDNPLVQAFFLFLTEAGTPLFYIVVVCVFYFAIEKKFAKRLGIIISISGVVNITLKGR